MRMMPGEETREIKISIPEELFHLFIPDQTLDHLLKAKKEMLLVFRSLIDAKIEALEKKSERKVARKRKVKIE